MAPCGGVAAGDGERGHPGRRIVLPAANGGARKCGELPQEHDRERVEAVQRQTAGGGEPADERERRRPPRR